MLLLLELLDDGVVEVQRLSFKSGSGRGIEIGLGVNAPAQAANEPDRRDESSPRHEHYQCGAQNQRISEQPYHQNLPYHRKNWLPTKRASSAMLPKNTPKGI